MPGSLPTAKQLPPSGRGRTMASPGAERITPHGRTAGEQTPFGASGLPLPEGEGRGEGEGRVGLDPCSKTDVQRISDPSRPYEARRNVAGRAGPSSAPGKGRVGIPNGGRGLRLPRSLVR